MKKRLLSLFLTLLMLLSMVPVSALAAEGDSGAQLAVSLEDGTQLPVSSLGTYEDANFGAGTIDYYQVTVPTGTAEGSTLSVMWGETSVMYFFSINNMTPYPTSFYLSENYGDFYAGELSEDGSSFIPYCAINFIEGDITVEQPEVNNAPALAGDASAEVTLTLGEYYQPNLAAVFSDADGDTLSYTVSVNGGEAQTVQADYSYTPAETGTVTLVFTANDGTVSSDPYTVTLNVEPAVVAVESVSLDQTALELEVNGTASLTATVLPDTASDKTVTWSSSNETVATVADGVITALAAGDAIITAKAGDIEAQCTVTVKANEIVLEGISFDKDALILPEGGSATLTAVLSPEGAAADISWASTNEAVATVTDGVITAVAAGTATITASAGEFSASCLVTVKSSSEAYAVTINAAPSTVELTFYNGGDIEDPLSAEVTDNGAVNGYHQYILTVPEGTYSYRGVDGETVLGGMTFEVPFDDEIMSDGTASGEGQVLYLRRANYYTTNTNIAAVGDYTLRLVPNGLPNVVNGEQYIDSNNYVVTPTLVMARGNALTYQQLVTINGDLAKSYAAAPVSNVIFSSGTTALDNAFTVKECTIHTIIAPQGAEVKVFNQINNFNVEEVTDKTVSEPDADGMVTHEFLTDGGYNLTYRVSMAGKITRAGYFGGTAETITVSYAESENPATTATSLDNANAQKRQESSTLLNVNGQNDLRLGVGETFRLRAYRAAWQIINTDTMNIMIEPDFHYNVISGGEHISMDIVDDVCTGNASANWVDITAVSAGTAVIEVTYDALQIGGNGTSYDGLYGATDPQRKGLLVIQVGAGANNLQMYANGSSNTFDAEFDTVYYTGDSGSLNFTATVGGETPDSVELSTDNGSSWISLAAVEGVYTAEGLVGGNNMLRFTKGGAVEYQVVRAAKVTVNVTNLNRSEGVIAGDQLKVTYEGLYIPVPKFSGIYNPGFGTSNLHTITYTLPDGYTATANSGQYDFINSHSYTLTVPAEAEAAEVTLSGGHISVGVTGSGLGAHRELTDAGVGTNMSAGSTHHYRAVLPDISFEVFTMPSVAVTVSASAEGTTVVLKDSEGTAMEAVDGVYTLPLGTFTYEASLSGYITERGSFEVTLSDAAAEEKTVTLNMRKIEGVIWDGSTATEPSKDESGAYLIGTGAEMAWFAANHGNANAVLTSDISLGGFNWTPVPAYAGTFDGNGHWITDLYINSTTTYQGLFAKLSANGVIKNLGVKGFVSSTNKYAGGITGQIAANASVDACVSDVTVTGSQYVGGIAGQQYMKSSITNCYNLGDITSTGKYAGGVSGGYISASSAFTIENCYNLGLITATSNYGGLTYSTNAANGVNSYYVSGSADNGNSKVGTVKTADELKTMASTLGGAYAADTNNINGGYPILTWQAVAKSYNVTLPEENNQYTVTGEATVDAGGDYSFTVEIKSGYKAGESFAVKVNDEAVEANEDGSYTVEKVSSDLTITVEGVEAKPVSVYLSISKDENFVKPEETGKVVALKQIEVPYFDLALYGMGEYYFSSESYGDDGDGLPGSDLEPGTKEYAEGKVTLLHLYIYATEIFHCGVDTEDAGKGYLFNNDLIGTAAFSYSGSPGSIYLVNFMGYDGNLNYYVNYNYPLASDGWGATADQILLRDGDVVTLGNFTSYSFYNDSTSVFNYIKVGDDTVTSTATQGDKVEMSVYHAGNGLAGDYTTAHAPVSSMPDVFYVEADKLSTGDFSDWTSAGCADENGNFVLDTANMAPGTYIVAIPGQYGAEYTEDICSTPGGILLTVEACTDHSETTIKYIPAESGKHTAVEACSQCGQEIGEVPAADCVDENGDSKCDLCDADMPAESTVILGDVIGNGEINANDAAIVYRYVNNAATLTEDQLAAADVDGSGTINANDAAMIYRYVNNTLTSFSTNK